MIVEPWVRRRPSAECTKATPSKVAATCRLTSLETSPTALRSTTRLVERRTGLEVTGAYLQSFGSTRTLSAIDEGQAPSLRWLVLESPGPPAGTSALKLMRERRGVTLRLLTRGCETVACRRTGEARIVSLARHGESDEITGAEFAMGAIALATAPIDNKATIAAVDSYALTGTKISKAMLVRLKLLGRLYQGKHPHGRRSASMIGLWADTCPRLSDWRPLAHQSDPFLQAYSTVFAPCETGKSRSELTKSQPTIATPTLMLTGADDSVAPPKMQALWTEQLSQVQTIEGEGHFWNVDGGTIRVKRWIAKHDQLDRQNRGR